MTERATPGSDADPPTAAPDEMAAAARRRLWMDGLGIGLSAAAFGIVYGLAARQAGFSLVEGTAMSILVFAGAAQFAAIGLVAQGVPWLGIVLLTALLNARHLLYSAALAPWFAKRSRLERAASAHVLTDEAFALALPAFRTLGRHDRVTYALAAAIPAVPWMVATSVGLIGGSLLPDPTALGIDVVFPAAMAGLAVALLTDRRSVIAAVAGALVGVAVALASQPSVGILVGGLAGPAIALALPGPWVSDPAPPDPSTGMPE
ncbi:MAG: AzlC family ABC transporter permease [Candidatus Limnocylindrales bacterium]